MYVSLFGEFPIPVKKHTVKFKVTLQYGSKNRFFQLFVIGSPSLISTLLKMMVISRVMKTNTINICIDKSFNSLSEM